MKRQKILLTCLFLSGISMAKAQSIGPSTLNASGGTKNIGSDTYEYSIGEMTLVKTASSSTIIVTQGVLQPNDNTASISDIAISDHHLKVFPIPSSTVITIQPSFLKGGKLFYQLLDASGKSVLKQSVDLAIGSESQQINIEPYASGNYMLHITYESAKEITSKSFKVQKIQ